jgi:hypothetical protein
MVISAGFLVARRLIGQASAGSRCVHDESQAVAGGRALC